MNGNYDYIIKKLGEPLYYDVYGAPHYQLKHWNCGSVAEFIQFMSYMRITTCQACGIRQRVQCCHPVYTGHRDCRKHYGDPPPVHGCIGDTMNVDSTEEFSIQETIDFLQAALLFDHEPKDRANIKKLINHYSRFKK